VADVVVEALRARGVTMMFGVPGGGTNLELLEAGARAGIRFVLTHSESAALFMAATYGEMTGRPGVALCTLGPGLANSANGLAHALLDRAPVILISDRYADAQTATVTHQTLDHAAVVRPLTKWTGTLTRATARAAMQRAISEACAEPAGPVHLDFPQGEETGNLGAPEAAAEPHAAAVGRGTPSVEDIGRAGALVESAQRPVVIAGLEVRYEAAEVAGVLAPIAGSGVPVLTTYKAKGIVPETGEWWGGIFTNALAEEPLVRLADLIALVGVDPVELIPRAWSYRAPVVSLRRAADGSRYLRPDVEVVTDLAAGIERIFSRRRQLAWTREEVKEHRQVLTRRLRSASGGLQPADVVEIARVAVPDDAIVAVDSGAHMFPATELWTAVHPGRFLISNGLATMGYALPAAVAASLVAAGAPVVCLTGDGGFLMQAGELETAARLNVRVIVVVLDDDGFSLIRVKQTRKGYASEGVAFRPSRLDRIAEALGIPARVAATVSEFRSAMRWAAGVDGPTFVCARIDPTAYTETFAAIRG
jgi:acetolactate synthase-1/2/3 large subunit